MKEYRAVLIEAVAEYDENLMEKFFEDEDSITEEEDPCRFTSCRYGHEYHSNGLRFCFQE